MARIGSKIIYIKSDCGTFQPLHKQQITPSVLTSVDTLELFQSSTLPFQSGNSSTFFPIHSTKIVKPADPCANDPRLKATTEK